MEFPSLKSQKLLQILLREPLSYDIVRQNGSHRKLESANGHPPLGFAFHDGVTVPGGAVRKILVKDVGLDEDEARKLVQEDEMRVARVIYWAEKDGWWSESPDFAGFTAVGASYGDVRELTHSGLQDYAGESLEFIEEVIAPDVVKDFTNFAYGLSFTVTNPFRGAGHINPMEIPKTQGFVPQSAQSQAPMEVTMVLCDAVQVADGKLYILGGGWSHSFSPNTPAQMALGVIIAVPWNRSNEKLIVEAVLVTADGESVEIDGQAVGAGGELEVGRPPGIRPGSSLNTPIPFDFSGIALDIGDYVWELRINGETESSVPFRVENPPGNAQRKEPIMLPGRPKTANPLGNPHIKPISAKQEGSHPSSEREDFSRDLKKASKKQDRPSQSGR